MTYIQSFSSGYQFPCTNSLYQFRDRTFMIYSMESTLWRHYVKRSTDSVARNYRGRPSSQSWNRPYLDWLNDTFAQASPSRQRIIASNLHAQQAKQRGMTLEASLALNAHNAAVAEAPRVLASVFHRAVARATDRALARHQQVVHAQRVIMAHIRPGFQYGPQPSSDELARAVYVARTFGGARRSTI